MISVRHYKTFDTADIKKYEKYKGTYDIVSTFDTETSKSPSGDFAFIILWQFYINGVVYYGRTVEQLQDFCKTLNNALKVDLIVYVHNLGYEWQFLRKYFEWDKVFAGDYREIYYCQTGHLLFKDSLKLSGQSLAKTCKGQAIEKAVGDWDYNQIRTHLTQLTELEKYYAENDCLCLAEYIEGMKRRYKHIKQIPLTKTGITRNNYREYIREQCKELDNGGSGKRKDGYNYYYRHYIKNAVPDLDTFYTLRKAYWGGFTHASLLNVGKTLKNVQSYDITSSYPTVMIAEKYPYKFYKVNAERFPYYFKRDYAIICRVRLYGLNSVVGFGYIPTYKVAATGHELDGQTDTKNYISDNGKLLRTFGALDYVEIYTTEIDLKIIKKVYKVEKMQIVGDCYISKKYYLPEVFRNFILKQYATKTELKDVEGREEEYQAAKGDINSLYGMTVTDPVREQFEEMNGDINRISLDIADYDSPAEYQKALRDIDTEQLGRAYRQGAHPIGLYQWGVYVTAYARRNLLKIILALSPDDFIYSDTDSIKMLHGNKYKNIIEEYNKEITEKLNAQPLKYTTDPKTIKGISKPLGVYDFEFSAEKFKCLRSKTYIYKTAKGLQCTVAGVPKKRIKNYLESLNISPFKAFKNGLKIPADFDPDTQKLGSVYVDEYHETFIYSTLCKAESSLVLDPLDFQIGNDSYYLELYEEMQNRHKGLFL